MKGTYKSSKDVLAPPESNRTNSSVNKGHVKVGLCPKKNYYIDKPVSNEEYVFFQGTVRQPFVRERQFNLAGVT